MVEFKKSKFKNLKFKSTNECEISEALSLLNKLGYSQHEYFNIEDAVYHCGLCAWDDGDVTEGYLSDEDFKEVTVSELKEMVCRVENENMVLWLNKETLEECWLHPFFCFIDMSLWVKVPDGATFATGDKDNFVFRKNGWYYDNQKGWWVATYAYLGETYKHPLLKLFWVKGKQLDKSTDTFTLERLLGCEVVVRGCAGDSKGYITKIINMFPTLQIDCGDYFELTNVKYLTLFTEDGDELTFDEYVNMYYP